MTDETASAEAPVQTAGGLLRKAREARGLHIAALATSLKIPPRKLESLERDRYDELPDVAFTRALAKSACRALKIDPTPVLALLPRLDSGALDQVSGGLNTPFRESSDGDATIADLVRKPAFWIVAVLAVAALGVYFWPLASTSTLAPTMVKDEPVMPPAALDPVASAPNSVASAPPDNVSSVVPVPPTTVEPAKSTPAAPAASVASTAPASLLGVRAAADSWVQVSDGSGKTLLSRLLQAGESIGLDGQLPLRVTIGNASGTAVTFRGVAVDLSAGARDNVARLELR